MEDDQGLSVRKLLCCGIQATPYSLVDKMHLSAAPDVAEASDGQGSSVIHLFGTAWRGAMGSTVPGQASLAPRAWHTQLGGRLLTMELGLLQKLLSLPYFQELQLLNLGVTSPLGDPDPEANFLSLIREVSFPRPIPQFPLSASSMEAWCRNPRKGNRGKSWCSD